MAIFGIENLTSTMNQAAYAFVEKLQNIENLLKRIAENQERASAWADKLSTVIYDQWEKENGPQDAVPRERSLVDYEREG